MFERLKKYTVSPQENKITVTITPRTRRAFVVDAIITAALFIIPPATLIVFGSIGSTTNIPLVIIGVLFLALGLFKIFYPSKAAESFEKTFSFSIDENGATIIDLKGRHHIGWQDIAMFGLVNNVRFPGKYSFNHSCMYFSVESQDEYFIRKQCHHLRGKMLSDAKNTSQMIVFTLPLENAEEEYNAFRELVCKYCDSEKERNFIEVLV